MALATGFPTTVSQEPDSYTYAPSEPADHSLLGPEWHGPGEQRHHQRPVTQTSSVHADSSTSNVYLSPGLNRGSTSFSPNPTLLASPSSRPGSLRSSSSSVSLHSGSQRSTRHAICGLPKSSSAASIASKKSTHSLREGLQCVSHDIPPNFPSPPSGISPHETTPFVSTTCPPQTAEQHSDAASTCSSRQPVNTFMTYPSKLKRYNRPMPKIHAKNPDRENLGIPAKTFKYPSTATIVPDGWVKHIHPDGTSYYYRDETKTYTDLDIRTPDKAELVEWYSDFMWHLLGEERGQFELVLDFSVEEGSDRECAYYFVNHAGRCLFWLDPLDNPGFLANCKGVDCLSHARFAVEAQYWHHWEHFPAGCEMDEKLVFELKNLILHSSLGHLTETRTVGAFSVTNAVESTLHQLEKYSDLVSGIDVSDQNNHDYSACIIGRLMSYFCEHKFNNFYGQACVRLRDDQSVYGWIYEPSWRMIILAPILFMAPVTNIRTLHNLYVDCIVRKDRWVEFVHDFKAQLDRTNLLATVLLSTNVGFLAIQSVDSYLNRTGRQVLSYFSIVASLTSIVLGLIFTERSRHDRTVSIDKAAEFLDRFHHPKHGLETLAFVFSLPFAYLMWGILLFSIAFSAECFNVGDDVLRGFMGGFVIFMVAPAAMSVWLSRDQIHHWWWQVEKQETVPEEDDLSSLSAILRSLKERRGALILDVWVSIKTYIPTLKASDAATNDMELQDQGNTPSADIENQPPVTPTIRIREATLDLTCRA